MTMMKLGLFAVFCVVAFSSATPASAKCTASEAKQITDLRNSWVTNWNAKRLDDVMKLYTNDANYLAPDGSRISGDEIKAYFQKLIGSKVSATSGTLDCSGDLAFDSGTYKQDFGGDGGEVKHVEGNYLAVLARANGKWLLVQHASTAKP
jgi:uncharacterized protein (TIGR02246 family)